MVGTTLQTRCAAALVAAALTVGTLGAAPQVEAAGEMPAEPRVIGLREVLQTALENNLDLVSASLDPELAELDVTTSEASFDASFQATANRSESESANLLNPTAASSDESDGVSASINQLLGFGATYSVGLGLNRFEQAGQFIPGGSSVQYSAGVSLDYTMPLLKGFGTEVNREQVLLARSNLDISRDGLEVQAQTTLESVEGAYWDLVSATEGLRIAEIRLRRAEDLLELNRKKVEVGTLAPIEVTSAEAGVASREEGVIVAEAALQDAQDGLLRLMGVPPEDPLWGRALEPTDKPVFETVDVDLAEAISVALDRRPELASARKRVQNSELSERVARRSVRHQLDFNVDLNPTGRDQDVFSDPDPLSGTESELIEAASLGDAIERVPDFDNYRWSASLTYRVPLRNRAAKAAFARAQINRERSEIDLEDQEQAIRLDVRRAVRSLESSIKRVLAARLNVDLQRKNVEAEQKRFENGISTSLDVLTVQENLADAEVSALRAVIDYNKALAALERAKGVLLESRGLRIEDVGRDPT